jgi:acyl-CoA dehydrogenase
MVLRWANAANGGQTTAENDMTVLVLTVILGAIGLAYIRASGVSWIAASGGAVATYVHLAQTSHAATVFIVGAWLVVACILGFSDVRRRLISDRLLGVYRRILPPMSQTEREAIDAGTVWWDGELFSGAPDWRRLLATPAPRLAPEEQSFLDNECEELCAMVDDWQTTRLNDLPPEAWQYIKDKGFLGMIIPKDQGGKGFSAYMHSQVIQKLSTRCSAAAVSVMVPNSLGPAELLLHYGTEEQKRYYLPRLARGEEIPCFGLTNPHAGSDAASIPDYGIVCRGMLDGREVLGMRVTWEKRYITLGPVATLLGLAVRLYDPDHLLGTQQDVGITCVLVPTRTPGVNIGRRHLPLNAVFQNGPNWGNDVFMPLEWIIGGPAMAGQGWRMLMECLAAGRSISLPSSATGYAKLAARATGGYARIRSQFKLPIGRFEGVEEALARMGGHVYTMDAVRRMTAGAVDLGEKPSVISAIAKYHLTERGRMVVNDAMDVLGGKGVCLGPSNFMGRAYQQLPIAITVEGANILTRSLIIFGQGAIRCHPYVLSEMRAAQSADRAAASIEFDRALWGHVRFAMANKVRAFVTGLTGAAFVRAPRDAAPELRRYYRQLSRLSAGLAFVADVSMLLLGGSLKRRERLSARLGDVLSHLYLASAIVKRYEDDGRPRDDLPLVHWSLMDSLLRIQTAFQGVFENYPNRFVGAALRFVVFPFGCWHRAPSDRLGQQVAQLLIASSATRDRLTAGMYLPRDESDVIGAIEKALGMAPLVERVEAKVRSAQKAGTLSAGRNAADEAAKTGVISAEEKALLAQFAALRDDIIKVDHFPPDFGAEDIQQPHSQRAAA